MRAITPIRPSARRAVSAALVLLALGAPAAMAQGFGPAEDLSVTGQDAQYPQLAVGADGATTVTWYRNNGSNYIVQAATRPGGSSTFGTPIDLSVAGRSAYDPQIAVGPDGATTVTWFRSNGTNDIVQAATRPAGSSTFGTPVDLSVVGRDARYPQIAVGPDGATTVTWRRSNGTNDIIQAATRPAGSSTFGTPVDLSATGQNAFVPQVAVGPDGATTVTWRRNNGTNSIIQAATRPAGSSTFGTSVDLSVTGQSAFVPQVAVGSDGATTITWNRSDGSKYIIQAATRPAGSSTFGTPVDLSATGRDAYDSDVAIGPDGATTVTWSRSDGSAYIIQARTRPAGSTDFGTVADLSATGQSSYEPQVAVGPDGTPTVTWYRIGPSYIVQASTGTPTLARLSVTRTGAGSGTVTSSPAGISCGTTCGAYFPIGSSVTLSAAPAAGSAFAGWGEACAGTSPSCRLQVSVPTSVSAAFSLGGSSAESPTVTVRKTRRTIGKSTITLTSSVRVSQAGTITQRAVRRGGRKQTLCSTKRTVTGAGTFSLTCVMGRSVTSQLRSGAIKYTLVTTITDTAGAKASTSSNGLLPKRPVRRTGKVPVTG